MFKKNTMARAEIIPQANDICRISKGTKITGIVISSADIRVDGVVEGTIYTKGKLVIGETSKIKGKLFCQSCDLWGTMEGEAYLEDVINFKAESSFTGDLKTPKLGIEVGTKFNGSCHIITKEEYHKYLKDIVGNTETRDNSAKETPAAKDAKPAPAAARQ